MTQVDDKPWLAEPNEKRWTHAGLECVIYRNKHVLTLCGYVVIPEEHPVYELTEDKTEEIFSVHGGVTWFGHDPHDNTRPEKFLGFDCAHYRDLMPGIDRESGYMKLAKLAGLTYRTMDWVTQETNRLAEQVAAYGITNEDEEEA